MTNSIPVTIKPQGDGSEEHSHPAFGTIVLTRTQGGSQKMFGSEVDHHLGRIHIKIQRAGMVRSSGHDFLHPQDTIVSLEMTHAQFAAFITGVGKGEGTPVTLLDCPATAAVSVPPIDEVRTRAQMATAEVRKSASEGIADIQVSLQELAALVETGKVPMKELRRLVKSVQQSVGRLPANMAYSVEVAETAIEEATNVAKIEVEAFVDATAKRLGLESIRALTAPPHAEGTK